ncbi:Uncharacterised protein [Mycobacteroides abscessus subsp. abscessus]|uniref:hypothetical protein n=1 Tax=Mycobacteroides abscessus TaxID=36809 RepID=UPI00092B0E8F|nr:hypothetical protein [Mycobacteroides abscessus]MDM2078756.1 hypothetical protein [Mycobacteroides abscessus]MDM2087460.1 hypothetical protein [Mycobacteroides abscessus]SHP82490.1 Uncharacterised protein [Mycobacteroides abscessus subsp. abscessus]SHQ13317.1 Uncharacterised protein [Mycobacteroides abscessus subsp. abscessus]SHQ26346.1 Uncharacterised protein [Mycobacteroides abscessus subsp. abscessus]
MSRKTRVSLAEDDYLLLVGQAAYMVSALEGLVIFDLPELAAHLPSSLNAEALASKTTGQIGVALTGAADEVADEAIRAYIVLAGRLLTEASSRRNDLFHSRPATLGQKQLLFRWKADDRRGPHLAFAIDTVWLNEVIDFLSEAYCSLNEIRPLHKHSSLTLD